MNVTGYQAHKVATVGKWRGWVDVPLEALEHGVFHGDNVFGHEVPPREINERAHAQLAWFEELDGQVERGHGGKLKDASIDGAGGQVAIEVGHGDGDHLAVEVEVVDDLVAPFADLLAP